MNIGQAAKTSGISAKMIRHYEAIGLVPPAERTANGYRDYADDDLRRFEFIRRARDLGFDVKQIRLLLGLWSDQARSNAQVKALALEHVAALEARATRLRERAAVLRYLADICDGDGRLDCPIIDGLDGRRVVQDDALVRLRRDGGASRDAPTEPREACGSAPAASDQ